jgi:hypothetical protein
MKRKGHLMSKNVLAVAAAVVICVVAVWFSTSIQGSQKTYELEPRLTIPTYKTDVARVVDAYERLMERYMDLTDRNLAGISTELKAAAKKLDSIDSKLTELSTRTVRIEKALGIEQTTKPPASTGASLPPYILGLDTQSSIFDSRREKSSTQADK